MRITVYHLEDDRVFDQNNSSLNRTAQVINKKPKSDISMHSPGANKWPLRHDSNASPLLHAIPQTCFLTAVRLILKT